MRVLGSKSERIEMIARAQRGRISQRQLIAAGIMHHAIARRIAAGYLLRLHRYVFAVGHLAATSLGAETAALLACRDGAVLSHHTAAALWGIRPPRSDDAATHITVLGGPTARVAGTKVHRTRLLDAQDTRIHDRLPVTSPARTLLDIAGLVTPRELERAYDEALIARLIRPGHLGELLARAAGRRGRRQLEALLKRGTGSTYTRSEAEERFLALARSARLPDPEVNTRLHGYEIDFLWRAQRLAVEVDGYTFHSSPTAFERDRRKDADLQAAGFTTTRVTWRQIEDEPYAVIARLAQALMPRG
jgi:very-short-patch-repair endonuclease